MEIDAAEVVAGRRNSTENRRRIGRGRSVPRRQVGRRKSGSLRVVRDGRGIAGGFRLLHGPIAGGSCRGAARGGGHEARDRRIPRNLNAEIRSQRMQRNVLVTESADETLSERRERGTE